MTGAPYLRLVLVAALAGLALLVARPAASPPVPALQVTAAGDVQIASSAENQAILNAANLRPGDSAEGSLTISNRAADEQKLRLQTVGVTDKPGPGGGELSSHLHLLVERTTATKVHQVYSGPVDGLTDVDLGVLAAAESQVYTFTATVPEGGPALDDPYAGSSVEVGWRWEAQSQDETAKEPKPKTDPEPETEPEVLVAPPATGTTAPRPAAAPKPEPVRRGGSDTTGAQRGHGADDEGPAAGAGASVRLWLGGPRVQRVKVRSGRRGGTLELLARCRPSCSVVARGKVRVGRRWVTLPARRVGAAQSRGAASKLAFKLSPVELRRVRTALARGRRIPVRLVVRATAPEHAAGEQTLALTARR